jgi:ArsR family transcriptional regulator
VWVPTASLPLLSDELAACCAPPAGAALDGRGGLVAAQQDSEECICNLTELVGVSQPTVSHHMRLLVEAGLLEREQRGKWAYYRLVPGALDALAGLLARVAQVA